MGEESATKLQIGSNSVRVSTPDKSNDVSTNMGGPLNNFLKDPVFEFDDDIDRQK